MKKKKKKGHQISWNRSENRKKARVPPSEKRSSYPIFSPSQILGGWLGENMMNQTCLKKGGKKKSQTYKSTTSCPCFLRAEMTWLKARLQAGVGGIVPTSTIFLVNVFFRGVFESFTIFPNDSPFQFTALISKINILPR